MALYAPKTRENVIVKWTLGAFLKFEANAKTKHELVAGRIYEMAGAVFGHNDIAMNIGYEAKRRLRNKGCRVVGSDQLVRIDDENAFYPDVSVVCGKPRFADYNRRALLNPLLVVEVTSPSSMRDDRGHKLDGYKSLPSVRHILIVDQHRVFAELHTRVDGGWRRDAIRSLDDSIPIDSLGISISMAEIYDGIDLDTIGV